MEHIVFNVSFLTARVDARQRVRNRTCLDLRRVDARRRVMHIHELVIDNA